MRDSVIRLLERGYTQLQSGNMENAEQLFRKALDADSGNIHALNLLGVVCVNTNRPEDAIDYISSAIAKESGDAQAHANLGLALKDLHRFDEAKSAFSASLKLQPANPIVLNNLGNVHSATGEHDAAVSCFRRALQLDGSYVDCLTNLSAALNEVGQSTGALAAADRALELKPDSAEAHNNRGEVLLKLARYADATESYRNAITLNSSFVDAKINLAAALKGLGDIDGAMESLQSVVGVQPDNARAYNNLGVLLEQLGRGAEAAGMFRKAIKHSPNYGNAYYQLAQLKGFGLDDDEISKVHELLTDDELLDEHRMPLHFALACAYENAEDYERSFKHLTKAQHIKALKKPYQDGKVASYYESIATTFSSCDSFNKQTVPETDFVPVFVMGMPRSGTSLTEQILDSHPQICGAGELSLMEDTVNEAKRLTDRPFPECWRHLSAPQTSGLGEFYLERLQQTTSEADFIVDKTPMNFQYVGFIAAILPSSRFIHCVRDPIDNCVSIYKLPFDEAHSYAHDLTALGKFYGRYLRMMRHWYEVFPDRILTVRYEETVADFESQVAKILNFLGVEMAESIHTFYETERIVKTPSASQVRQPIYSTSVQKWKLYERQIQPLLDELAEASHVEF